MLTGFYRLVTANWKSKRFCSTAEEHKEVLQKYCPMPSEREIRKLYVNGRTICIEFFFCLLKIFQRPQDAQPLPKVAILGAWGLSLNKHFGGVVPRQNRKYVHICIACQSVKTYMFYRTGKSKVLLDKREACSYNKNISVILYHCYYLKRG